MTLEHYIKYCANDHIRQRLMLHVACYASISPSLLHYGSTHSQLLVTSNDSRVRLYNLKDHELSCKYKGYLNTSSQIKATFSRDGQYVITGSEDNYIYIWKTHLDLSKLSSARRDRNEFYESFTGEKFV